MVQQQYTTSRKKGKHLNAMERGKIEAFLEMNLEKTEIAKNIGVCYRTVSREIKRGWVQGLLRSDLSTYDSYSSQKGQREYEKQQKRTRKTKFQADSPFFVCIETLILENHYSPYAALEEAKKLGYEENVSLRTLYSYIEKELFPRLRKEHLPYHKKKKCRENSVKTIRKKLGRSIEERSPEIDLREDLGHFEMDTVVGPLGSKACLLVLTERKTRLEFIRKLPSKSAKEVVNALRKIVEEHPDMLKTITTDNGSEFMDLSEIESLGIPHFYAHSYCSWERGSNENNNKLIRRFFPKGMSFEKISEKKIQKIEKWMNGYPRKLFQGKSANEIYIQELKMEL